MSCEDSVVFVAYSCVQPSSPSKVHKKWCTTATSADVTASIDWVATSDRDHGCSFCLPPFKQRFMTPDGHGLKEDLFLFCCSGEDKSNSNIHLLKDACRTGA